ncbi:MAG: hypothetical protein IT158_11520, partial [Bryobacterales bacterium]|nr:hypothetical protein [Bryobacterales bacterium]
MNFGNARSKWAPLLARVSMAVLLFEALSGLAVTFGPFHPAVEWGLLAHTLVGVLTLLPLAWYSARHWSHYRDFSFSHILLLGYLGLAGLLVCSLSGLVVTWQGLLASRTSPLWRNIHLVSALVVLATAVPHLVLAAARTWKTEAKPFARACLRWVALATAGATGALALLPLVYPGERYENRFPSDYHYLYGKDRPFAPSLAQTSTGGPLDARSLAGSATCGSAGCHTQIYREWLPSAHRYAAKDVLFQDIQAVMAKQNGPESTRYCSGCHDPISLFSGTKNIFVENLTRLEGYNEGVSCLSCHAIQKTDLRGNANYVITQPRE